MGNGASFSWIFQVSVTWFVLAVCPVSLTELCSFWYSLIDLFSLHKLFMVKKDPVTPEMLKALVESKITDKSPSISDLRSLCLIGYAGFFRDVKFLPS